MTKATRRTDHIKQPLPNQIIELRGGTWRFIREERGFWELELVKQGAQFVENPSRVWALPQLEAESLKILDSRQALTPRPHLGQLSESKFYRPIIQTKLNQSLQDSVGSNIPTTALHCAIQHKDWQFEPWRRIVDILPFPRILIADDVGLGKTTEAAIILAELSRRQRADRVLIVTPQHLTEKWQDELYERFGLAFEIYDRDSRARLVDRGVKNPWEVVEKVIVSRDFLKRWENLKPLENVDWDMIVIDEAHHFVREKSKGPSRLRELAEKIVYRSPGLIMLSATPFTGSVAEFHSLLTLIDPKFHDPKSSTQWDPTNPHLVRRLKSNVKAHGEDIKAREIRNVIIAEADLGKREADCLKRVHSELSEESSRANREHWDRLLEETARKRLSSSWSAFLETITTSDRLRSWFSAEILRQIGKLVESQESAKLKAFTRCLRDIHKQDPKAKVVVFTEAISTQLEILRYLKDKGGYDEAQVAAITGGTVRLERQKIEDQFSSHASQLLILVATDTIAEGKDLQHACHNLIHFELPWSLVKIEQRNGRIDRLGQKQTPRVHNLILDTEATPDQRIIDRLISKLDIAKQSLGSVSPIIAQLQDITLEQIADGGKTLEKAMDELKRDTLAFGFDLNAVTPLSSAPLANDNLAINRQQAFELMLKTVGGTLQPYGRLEKQFMIGLPKGWELSGLKAVGDDDYPSTENPWRVTFDPTVFLAYEDHRREHGETKDALHFLSPIHPVVIQIEARFRAKVDQKGYPVFAIKNMLHKQVILAEITTRSRSSRILTRKIVALETKTWKEVDLGILSEFLAVRDEVSLPSASTWEAIIQQLEAEAAKYGEDLQKSYEARLRACAKDQKSLPNDIKGREQRARWLSDLWEVDCSQTRFQIIAFLVKQGA